MGLIKEFREFAVKGNMIDMAIGIIIGVAFNAIVNSLVKDIIMPAIGYFIAGINFKDLAWELKPTLTNAEGEIIREAVVVSYGNFIQQSIDFLIIALTIFFVVKVMNRLKTKAEDNKVPTVETPKDIELLSEIRDGIKQLNKKS